MKQAVLVCIMLPLLVCGAADRRKAAPKAAPAKKAAPAPAPKLVVPPDAVRIDANTWRHTDKEGRTWRYVQSPFGVTRFEVAAQSAAAPADTPADMKSFEEGDSVRFERPSPFGVIKWTRKKTELSALEQRVWERDRQAAAATAAPAEDKGNK